MTFVVGAVAETPQINILAPDGIRHFLKRCFQPPHEIASNRCSAGMLVDLCVEYKSSEFYRTFLM